MLTLALLLLQATPASACPPVDRARLMALDFDAFDQDMTGGWRPLNAAGCDREAADLIRDYAAAHPELAASRQGLLAWHEGQLRANAGDLATATVLMERSRRPAAIDAMGWNLYLDGSVAFLRRDRAALQAARAKLAALPRPADFAPIGPDGKPIAIRWPMNLSVLDGFVRCWDRPYKAAYSCAAPMRVITLPTRKR